MKGTVKLLFEELRDLLENGKREGAIQHLKWNLAKSRKTIDTFKDEASCRNLLHYAVAGREGHPEVVEFLLEMGASVHVKPRFQI